MKAQLQNFKRNSSEIHYNPRNFGPNISLTAMKFQVKLLKEKKGAPPCSFFSRGILMSIAGLLSVRRATVLEARPGRHLSIIAAYFLILTSQYSTAFSFRSHQKT